MTHWGDAVLSTAAIVVALTVISGAMWKLYGITKNIEAAIGRDEDGHTLAENVRVIRGVLFPPGQVSLPHRVDLMESDLIGVKRSIDRIGSKLDLIEVAVIRQHGPKETDDVD